MNNKIFPIILMAASTALSSGVNAGESKFYGRLDLAVTHSDTGVVTQNGKSGTVLENNLSRVGFTGSEYIKKDVQMIYRIEVQVNSMTDDDKVFKPRNTYLGVKSNLGTFLVGRNDTVFRTSSGRAETFGLTNAGYSSMIAGQFRKADGLTYYSPELYDLFSLNFTYLMEDNYQGEQESQHAASVTFGDKSLKADSYYAAVSYNTVNGVDAYRGVVHKKWGDLKLAGLYQNTKSQVNSKKEGDSYVFGVVYNLDGINLKLEYTKDKAGFGKYFKNRVKTNDGAYDNTTGVDIDSLTLGADYRLSKSTRIATHYSMYSGEYSLNNNGSMISLDDENVATVSLRYDF